MRKFCIALLSIIPLPALAVSAGLLINVKSPAPMAIPQGAQRVAMLTLDLKASCVASARLNSLTLRRSGLGSASDILRVYTMQETKRISRSSTVPAKDPFTLRLNSFNIPACQTATVTIVADLSANAAAGGEHRLELLSADASTQVSITNSALSTPRPVTPNSSAAQLAVTFRPLLGTVSYGTNRVVSRFLLTSTGTRDQQITAITFKNAGSASDSDMQNLRLETSGHKILSAAAAQMEGKTVRIVLSVPLTLGRSDSVLLELHADIRARRSHTINWTIEEPSDVEAQAATR